MHFDDNLKNGGPSTTAVMILTRTHPSPIAAITNPPIFPQNPLARRQANDPRLCGYINGDPGTLPCPPPPHLTLHPPPTSPYTHPSLINKMLRPIRLRPSTSSTTSPSSPAAAPTPARTWP